MMIGLQNRKDCLGMLKSSGCNVVVTVRKTDVYELERHANKTVIQCLGGRVWITRKGDLEDYFIDQGQTFVATLPGKVVVQGFPYGTIDVSVC